MLQNEWIITRPLGRLKNVWINAPAPNPHLPFAATLAIQERVRVMHATVVDGWHLALFHFTRMADVFLAQQAAAAAAAAAAMGVPALPGKLLIPPGARIAGCADTQNFFK
ncbi:hypothetical protein HDU90_007709 [Geranomyces variabilis]|nr:hypothetical protein HDU90_007709 [Geranomyces variabilis]